jgi:hypothetical protein
MSEGAACSAPIQPITPTPKMQADVVEMRALVKRRAVVGSRDVQDLSSEPKAVEFQHRSIRREDAAQS